jgi:GrpB-like predicted nucleotidyltransferase (UPF0157 family)
VVEFAAGGMGGMSKITIVDYNPKWPGLFEELRRPIERALADIAITIEHVGSTSVPGLAAKPIIDMDVVVAEADVAAGISRLAELGYNHQGDLGIPMREAFSCPEGSTPHHLYLCPLNSPALANHVKVRDYLRRNSEAAHGYGDLKKRLAVESGGDIRRYGEAKTAFLVAILRDHGFSESRLSDIEIMNRNGAGRAV